MKNPQILKNKNDRGYEKWKNNRRVPSNKYEIEERNVRKSELKEQLEIVKLKAVHGNLLN